MLCSLWSMHGSRAGRLFAVVGAGAVNIDGFGVFVDGIDNPVFEGEADGVKSGQVAYEAFRALWVGRDGVGNGFWFPA